jgi:predicted O-methyltransferase YrrM
VSESPPAADTPAPFAEILADVARVEGWMTDDQARRLHDRARALGAGARIVEIGSFRGRSLIVLARSAAPGVEIVSIDPHAGGDRGPQEIEADQARGDDDHSVYQANLAAAGVRDRVRHIRATSDAALDDLPAGPGGEIDLLYIDGAHRFGPARSDIVDWGDRVSGGGVMLIHDSFSSIGVTLALITTMFVSGEWRYVGRSQSMAEYRRERLTGGERLGNLLRQALQLPWFARNVAIKFLLTVNLAPLTRIFGHRTRDWPY